MKIIYDMSYIRDKGLHVLDDNYFWPVDENKFQNFSKNLYTIYEDLLLASNDDRLISVGFVEISFINLLLQILHCNFVKQYAKKNKVKLYIDDFDEYQNPNWKEIGSYYSNQHFIHNKPIRSIRRYIKYFVFNKQKICFKNFAGKNNKCISVGSASKLRERYINHNNLCCDYYDYPDLFSDTDKRKDNSELIEKFRNDIIDKFFEKIKSQESGFTSDFDFDLAKAAWIERFSGALSLYNSVKIPKKYTKILFTESAKAHHKIIIRSLQDQGLNVYCFHHGNDTALIIQDVLHKHNVSHCQNFIVPSRGVVDVYSKAYKDFKLDRYSKTKYISVSNKEKKQDLPYNSSENLKPKVVMLMGYPYNSSRYPDERGMFFLPRIDLERRLIIQLNKLGLKVIYKAHPDRKKEIAGVFDNMVEYVEYAPFEDVCQKADIVIFTYVSTTTFGHALKTGQRILLISNSGNNINNNQWSLLGKQVHLIPTEINNKSKIIYDTDLLDSMFLDNSFSTIDYSYINRIMT